MTEGSASPAGRESDPGIDPAAGLSLGAVSGCIPPRLRAGRATLVLIAYLAAHLAIGPAVGIAMMLADKVLESPPHLVLLLSSLTSLLGYLLAGLLMVGLCRSWFPRQLVDTSPQGAAWSVGRFGHLIAGLVAGALLGAVYLSWKLALEGSPGEPVSPVNLMSLATAGQLALLCIVVVILAPLIEELLFRGVLYGGFRRSFGPAWAALVTTLGFLLLHSGQIIHNHPMAFSLAVLAVTTLIMRLRCRAVGPAVTLHAGYNLALIVFQLITGR